MYHGTQKITMGRGRDTDYESKKSAALAQAGQNDYIFGVQPQADSEMTGDMAADRVSMIAQGVQYPGLNDRQQIYGA